MTNYTFEPSRANAELLDAGDELATFRDRFIIKDPNLLYMDGNSLGRLTRDAVDRIESLVAREWGERLIRGWNEGWYEAPLRVGDKIAPLIGAAPGQVVVADSTSVNLFKAVVSALRLRPARRRIVTDEINFPTDLYIAQGAVELIGEHHEVLRIGSVDGGVTPDLEELVRSIDGDTAVVVLSHVAFKSGFLYDMQEVTDLARAQGALIVWDLSHSVGAVPIELDRCRVDFAVGCTYKYLNGGPGAPAFIYLRRELQAQAVSPIWGWFGQRNPFSFDLDYLPAPGIARFQAGTPPMLSLLAVESGIAPTVDAGMEAIRRKSVAQTDYLIRLADAVLSPLGFSVASPREPERRGSHVALRHREGYRIARALIDEMQVIPDFREPDIIRIGCAPLYTSFAEIWETIDRMRIVVEGNRYDRYPPERNGVT